MKKVLFCISIAVMAFLLSACQIDITKQVANEEQIFNDISDIDSIKHCFKSDFVYESEYVCKDIEIIKRQINKEEKEDLVFVTAIMENDYFNVTLDLSLTYNFYDEGGWILDENNWNVIDVKPISVPEYTLVKDKISTYNSYEGIDVEIPAHETSYKTDKYSIKNIAVESYDEYIYLAEYAHCTPDGECAEEETRVYAYFDVNFDYFEGLLETYLVFEKDGWKIPNANYLILKEVISTNNMSSMIGNYGFALPLNRKGATLQVYDVYFEDFMILCEYDYWVDGWSYTDYIEFYGDGHKMIVKFNPFNLTMNIDDLSAVDIKYHDYYKKLMYVPSEDCWKYRDDYNGQYSYNELIRI